MLEYRARVVSSFQFVAKRAGRCWGAGAGLFLVSGLWLRGWWCQAGTEVVLPANTPPPGVECPCILPCQLRLGPRRACRVPAAGWTDRGCLYGTNNGLQTSRPETKGCLSSLLGLVFLGGDRRTGEGLWA